jgi:hypothetical protein
MPKEDSNFSYTKSQILNPYPTIRFKKDEILKNDSIKNFLRIGKEINFSDLNSLMYRSEEFTDKHDGLHILFCGDSYTWGYGLLEHEVWSKIIYNKIAEQQKCSGYFNLSFPAISPASLIFDMFKYFKCYGNPDIIFLNIPIPYRMFRLLGELDGGHFDLPIANSLLEAISYQYYFILEQYCYANNIKLYCFSWFKYHKFMCEGNISRFYDIFESFEDWLEKNPIIKEEEFAYLARDSQHPGTAIHKFYADAIYERFCNDNFRS